MKKLLVTLPLFLMIMGCNQAPMSADPSVLSARTEAFEAALNAGDIDALVMIYTSDARLLPPNGEMTTGRDAARAIFGGMIDAGISGDLTSIDAKVSGDMGYDVGTYTLMDGDTVVDTGKFIEIFHRGDDGEWRISNDIWNSDVPVAAPMQEDEPMEE
jgi:ketosteroid isomerase-like protein